MKDFCLGDKVTVSDEVELIIQQIDLVFDTINGEVLGENFGSNFYDFIWDMRTTSEDISRYTESVIYGYVKLFGWKLNVSTDILEGTENDIILITIKLSNYGTSIEKTYKVE